MIAAFGWGLLAGSALLLGALIGWYANPGRKITAAVMAFGSGVLMSAIAFDLMEEAAENGGLAASASGFLLGAAFFTTGAMVLSRLQVRGGKEGAAAAAIALGASFDGIPEAIVIGLSVVHGAGVSLPIVIAIFLSNVPEGMSSATGLKAAGYSRAATFGLWVGIALMCASGSLIGYTLFDGADPEYAAIAQGVAAGAMLAMIADTMIPEAFDEQHDAAGLITALGFLVAFLLSHRLA